MTVLLALLSAMQVLAYDTRGSDDPRLQMARGLFEKYVSLEHAYDARVADLYADEALIRNKRTYPNGQIREVTFPAPQYRALIRTAMPLAKLKGDKSTYSKLTYTLEGDVVRIKADRYSVLKKYHSPISLLVKRAPSGEWLIYEEVSESQP